ncbi:diaminopimelate epimerase [Deinococcus ruber]|uniref:Diaminopimelate epimerase n=1 Tax=Deinococcus ruber TaxID=1848197 RepID=A0A918F9W1_9DEIO|nr:diaminopimelate epimerase [Deinococcus ruber]
MLRFVKMQGCGNDFVVVNGIEQPFHPTPDQIRRLADRHFGVGCDQVLAVHASTTQGIDFEYRIYNADGQEVGQCGNGSRAIARFIYDQGLSNSVRLTVRTRTAQLHLERLDSGDVRVDMGRPSFLPPEIPLLMAERSAYELPLGDLGTVQFGVVNLGNPHAVIVVESVDLAAVGAIGQALQQRPEFPESVNVGFLQVVSPTAGRLRVYERGAGETLACGSGACAAFAVARRRGWMASSATIEMPGGPLTLGWQDPEAGITLGGPVETVFSGEWHWDG